MPTFKTKEDEAAHWEAMEAEWPTEEQLLGDEYSVKVDRSDSQKRLSTVKMKLKRRDKYCDEKERESITKLARGTWWRKRREGTAPNPFKRYERNYWFESDVLSWVAGKRVWKFPVVEI